MTEQTRKQLAETGLKVRREVLGDEYVDRALNGATDFNQPLQELLNEFCWGAVWSREGLSRRDRSLINLAMLTALGKQQELGTHVRGALNNGVTETEIAEVILQTAIYCGVPAAVESFRTATKVVEEYGS